MDKKDKIELSLEILLALLCAGSAILIAQANFNLVFPLFLLFIWSLLLLATSWKHIRAKYAPQLTKKEKEAETVDEVVFSMHTSKKHYLKNTLFYPFAATLKTWSYIIVIIYLVFISFQLYNNTSLFVMLYFFLPIAGTFGFSVRSKYKTISKKYDDYRKASLLFIFNKNGMLGAIPRLSTDKNQNMVYIYTAFNDWLDIHEIVFYKTHIEVYYSNNLKEYLVADNEKQLTEFKKIVSTYYRQPHKKKDTLNLLNYYQIVSGLCGNAISISTQESNSFHLGESYIAPIPSVPKNFKWPQNHKLPLSFLAQINCKDLAPHDSEELLPKEGMLYFFYEMREMLLNEQGNQGCARVVYSNVPSDQLFFHKDSTKSINPAYLLRQRKLQFHSKTIIPDYTEACQLQPSVANSNPETYNYSCWLFKRRHAKEEKNYDEMVQFFGKPIYHTKQELVGGKDENLVLLMQMTLTKDDFYAYYLSLNDYSKKGAQYRDFFDKWEELPCQLYYFIPKDDLKRLDFSNIYFARRGKSLDDLVLPEDFN